METLELLDLLEDAISKGVPVPLTGKCMLDKEELLELLQEIRLNLPNDLKQAKWVKEERQRILDEAKKEADEIVKGAEEKIISLINEHEITKKSVEQANQILESAKLKTKEMNNSSLTYADNLLEFVEGSILKALKDIEMCTNEIRNNRSELRK